MMTKLKLRLILNVMHQLGEDIKYRVFSSERTKYC